MNDMPTIFDCVLAIIYTVPCLAILIACVLPLNPFYDPKGDDPYRYCPKEEEM